MNNIWFLSETLEERWAWMEAFTKDECDLIIEKYKDNTTPAKHGGGQFNNDIRNSHITWLDTATNIWIYERCSNIIKNLNSKYFNFDLTFIEPLQFSVYKCDNGHYSKHIDNLYSGHGYRKLSFSILLNDSSEYSGGELQLHLDKDPLNPIQKQGVMVAFPSNVLHEVIPVTSGTRYALVGWCNGPKFK